MLFTGIEPRISGSGSNRSTNCATPSRHFCRNGILGECTDNMPIVSTDNTYLYVPI